METLLITLVGILLAGLLVVIGWIVRLVFEHEATDTTLINEVNNLGGRLDNVETRVDQTETRVDQTETRLGRIETRVDNIEEKLVAVLEALARIEQKITPPPTASVP